MTRRLIRGFAGVAGTVAAVLAVMAIPFPDLSLGLFWVLLTISAGLLATVAWAGRA